ncbi:MAG: hypothetical protein AAF633_14900 [Chloroflexota bacterium]
MHKLLKLNPMRLWLVLIVLGACTPQAVDTGPFPTAELLRSERATTTLTFTPTPTPSLTPSVTPTLAATDTATPTPTSTPASTETEMPSSGSSGLNSSGSAAGGLDRTLTPPASAASDPNLEAILYVQGRESASEIVFYDLNTNARIQLTDNGYSDFNPAWSPDGSQIVFGFQTDSGFGLNRLSLQSYDVVTLINRQPSLGQPVWSPDGSTIYVHAQRNGVFGIYSLSSRGGQLQPVVTNQFQNLNPSISADGRLIAYTETDPALDTRRQLVIFDLVSLTPTRLTEDASISHYAPDWSPDAAQLVYYKGSSSSNSSGLYIFDIGSRSEQQLTFTSDFLPKWQNGEDGEWIWFHRRGPASRKIYKIRPDGSQETLVVDAPSQVYDVQPLP